MRIPARRYSGGDWHADEYETPDEYARRIWEEMQVWGGIKIGFRHWRGSNDSVRGSCEGDAGVGWRWRRSFVE